MSSVSSRCSAVAPAKFQNAFGRPIEEVRIGWETCQIYFKGILQHCIVGYNQAALEASASYQEQTLCLDAFNYYSCVDTNRKCFLLYLAMIAARVHGTPVRSRSRSRMRQECTPSLRTVSSSLMCRTGSSGVR